MAKLKGIIHSAILAHISTQAQRWTDLHNHRILHHLLVPAGVLPYRSDTSLGDYPFPAWIAGVEPEAIIPFLIVEIILAI